MNPLVSIIVPVYNTEDYLDQCLETILAQTYRDIEVICVDDGSTDGSPDILRRHAEADERLTVLAQANRFAGAARNRGIEQATGEFLLFLDADDYFDERMVERMVANAQANGSDIVICHSSYYNQRNGVTSEIPDALLAGLIPDGCADGSGTFSGRDVADRLFQLCLGWPWDKLFRRSFVEAAGLRFQSQRSSNDALFVYLALALAERISIEPERLPFHRIHNERSTSNTRTVSCECACHAMQAIRDALVERGCYGEFERSFVNWEVEFSLWNFDSLWQGEARMKMLPLMREIRDEHIKPAERPEGYFDKPGDVKRFVGMMSYDRWYGTDSLEAMRAEPWVPVGGEGEGAGAPAAAAEGAQPKVSVIVPIYNVEGYLTQALDSLAAQTLADIEVICVDDGSTDGSLLIAKQRELDDPRFVVVCKPNGGYGSAMNVGLDAARGRYVGILEPDDYVLPRMFESLYRAAEAHRAQIAKADFYRFVGDGDEQQRWLNPVGTWDDTDLHNYNRVICPVEEQEMFTYIMNTWCGIYRTDFLREHGIRHNETPGASFQDNGFWFMGYAHCERLVIIREPGYMNRRDNPGSSVKDRGKSMACRNEYLLMYERLHGEEPELFARLSSTFWFKYMQNVTATLDRVDEGLWAEVLAAAQEDLGAAVERGEIDFEAIPAEEAADIRGMVDDPLAYTFRKLRAQIAAREAQVAAACESAELRRQELDELYGSYSFRVGSALMAGPSALKRRLREGA